MPEDDEEDEYIEFTEGDEVWLKVVFGEGTKEMKGELICIVDGEAYVRTSFGDVVGDAATLEPV